jgi:hypothetical protein
MILQQIAQLVYLRAVWPGFDSQQGQDTSATPGFRPALRSTQPPAQWVPGALLPGLKRPGCGTDHSPPSSAEVKNSGAIPPLPHSLHGVVLK